MENNNMIKTFSGDIANHWEDKSKYIYKIKGNDNKIISLINNHIKEKSKILEIGFGTGKLIKQIDDLFCSIDIVGVEANSDMFHSVKNRDFRNEVSLYNCGIKEYISIIEEKKFDIIILKQVLHHLENRKQIISLLNNILSVEGRIFIMTPNEKYQKTVIPFETNKDCLGRISYEMMIDYLEGSQLVMEYYEPTHCEAYFKNLHNYFTYLYSIGTLQKIYNYESSYEYVLKFIEKFHNLFVVLQVN